METCNFTRRVRLVAMGTLFVSAMAMAADDSNMAATIGTWESAYNAGDLETVQALYAEDGCRMPPNAQTASGSAAILAQLQESKQSAPTVELDVNMAETAGNRSYATGTYAVMNAEGERIDHGKWMNVSHNVDGNWVIHCDIWNSNLPLPAAA